MAVAFVLDARDSSLVGLAIQRPVPPVAASPQVMLDQPVPNRRRAAVQLPRDLRERRATLDKRLELLAGQAAAGRVLVAAVGDEAVLLDPIANGRGIPVSHRTNLGQRKTIGQIALQEVPIHGRILAGGSDGKSERMFAVI